MTLLTFPAMQPRMIKYEPFSFSFIEGKTKMSKMIAGIATALVIAAAGVTYVTYLNPHHCSHCGQQAPSVSTETPSCCQESSQATPCEACQESESSACPECAVGEAKAK